MLTIFSDSMATLAYTKDPKYHGRTKQINIHFHYIPHIIVWREMALRHISTNKMMVDLVTKVNNKVVFQTHLRSLGPRFEILQFISDISWIDPCRHDNLHQNLEWDIFRLFFENITNISIFKKDSSQPWQPLGQICPQLY